MHVQRMHGWVGRKDRDNVEVDAVVYRDGGDTVRVKLTNVSDQGCRMESGETFRIGELVHISLPEMGRVQAQVRWALPGSAGAQFIPATF